MFNYKQRLIHAKKIYDKNNIKPKPSRIEVTEGVKKVQEEIYERKKYANKLAKEYFDKNRGIFIDETFEYFIACLEKDVGESVFQKTHKIEYDNYPVEIVGYYEEVFREELVRLIKENIEKHIPNFCSFDVESDGKSNRTTKQIKFCLWIRIVMCLEDY